MMAVLLDLVSWSCILVGAAAVLIGGLGLLRLPDVFARMHGAGMIDTLGLGAILVGLMVQSGFTLITVKLLLVLLFVLYTSPVVTHALARACLNAGVEPQAHHKPTDGGGPSKR
jgi:multicomponent Na+:H+ antiporter subunit G